MNRIIPFLLSFCFLLCSQAQLFQPYVIVAKRQHRFTTVNPPPSVCSLLEQNATFVNGSYVGYLTRYYAGQSQWNNASAQTICKRSFHLSGVVGNITGFTYVARIWTMTGGNLLANVATSVGITGNNSWNGLVEFTFSTPYTTTGGVNYAMTIDHGGLDDSNVVLVGKSASTGLPGTFELWDSTGVFLLGSNEETTGATYSMQ